MWTRETLNETIRRQMAGRKLVVVSNRQPYGHVAKGGKIVCQRQPGGLVTALGPILEATGGLWVAMGATEQDRTTVDAQGCVRLPPENPSYTLRRIFLTKEEMDAYYHGYCNEGLWPLCHIAFTRPQFTSQDWKTYQDVNRKFADAIIEQVGDQPALVWVQDYHLTLVAKYLRERGATNISTSMFWHIPWPNPEILRICPQRKEILDGMLNFDLLGFHLRYHGDNFLATVDREMESRIDRERFSVWRQGHETLVRSFPISVDFESIARKADVPDFPAVEAAFRDRFSLGDRRIILGADRIDYTKGIPERLKAFSTLLETHPEYRKKVTLFQIGQISRLHVPAYKRLNDELNALVEEINWKYSEDDWVPVIFTREYIAYDDILKLFRLADVCVVTSLHDGMNLVAKEYPAARVDGDGVLLLSHFTGSARELEEAILINPFDIDETAAAMATALAMPEADRRRRMKKLRESVASNNIYRWAGRALADLLKFEFQDT